VSDGAGKGTPGLIRGVFGGREGGNSTAGGEKYRYDRGQHFEPGKATTPPSSPQIHSAHTYLPNHVQGFCPFWFPVPRACHANVSFTYRPPAYSPAGLARGNFS